MAQNIAEFRIIGRIGAIEIKDKVTYLDVASNYRRKDGKEWNKIILTDLLLFPS